MIDELVSFVKVWWFFKSYTKACLWFEIPNPLLGGVTPMEMIEVGRAAKLRKIITQQLEMNKPPKGCKNVKKRKIVN